MCDSVTQENRGGVGVIYTATATEAVEWVRSAGERAPGGALRNTCI